MEVEANEMVLFPANHALKIRPKTEKKLRFYFLFEVLQYRTKIHFSHFYSLTESKTFHAFFEHNWKHALLDCWPYVENCWKKTLDSKFLIFDTDVIVKFSKVGEDFYVAGVRIIQKSIVEKSVNKTRDGYDFCCTEYREHFEETFNISPVKKSQIWYFRVAGRCLDCFFAGSHPWIKCFDAIQVQI